MPPQFAPPDAGQRFAIDAVPEPAAVSETSVAPPAVRSPLVVMPPAGGEVVARGPRHDGRAAVEAPDIALFPLDEAVGRGLRRYATFTGRASRSEYWWFALAVNLALYVFAFAGMVLFGGLVRDPALATTLWVVPYGLLGLGLLLPLLGALVRRLHDSDRPGSMLLLAFVPLVGPFILLVLLTAPGTPGDNRYGSASRPGGDPGKVLPTLVAAVRIPVQFVLIGAGSMASWRFLRVGLNESWHRWWLLSTLTFVAAVACMLAMRRVVPSRWLLGFEVVTAGFLAFAPWAPTAAAPWRDWPELLFSSFLPTASLLAMAWFGVALVSGFPRLQAGPGSPP